LLLFSELLRTVAALHVLAQSHPLLAPEAPQEEEEQPNLVG